MLSKISNISFKSTPLYGVKIKKRDEGNTYKNVDAIFSVLNPDDKNDIKAVRKVGRRWWRTKYTNLIRNDFRFKMLSPYLTFYALELKGSEPLDKRIVSLCEVSKSPFDYPGCYVNFLQASPEALREKNPKYKGSGEVTLYGVVREAKKDHIKHIKLTSNDKSSMFYKHIGFKPEGFLGDYALYSQGYKRYISRVENKYNFWFYIKYIYKILLLYLCLIFVNDYYHWIMFELQNLVY